MAYESSRCDCEGFAAYAEGRRVGLVLRCGETVEVSVGRLGIRTVRLPAGEVERVDPREQRVILRARPLAPGDGRLAGAGIAALVVVGVLLAALAVFAPVPA